MAYSTSNAKDEFLEHIQGKSVRCATLVYTRYVDGERCITTFNLKENYNDEEFNEFLKNIDFIYFLYRVPSCERNINGTIWYENSQVWSARVGDKRDENWEYYEIPNIPDYLK